jgi:hypothetical protein
VIPKNRMNQFVSSTCSMITGRFSTATRPANPLTDRRFDPPGGGSNKLLRGRAEHEHGRCVDVQKLSHPLEQLGHRSSTVEMGECRVGRGLNPAQYVVMGGRHVGSGLGSRSIQECTARVYADAPSIDVAMSAATAGPKNNSALVRERHIAPRTIRSPIPGYSSSTGAIALSIQP